MRATGLSTQARLLGVALAATTLLAACAATQHVAETDRLQAQNAYEQGVQALTGQQWAIALTRLRQATSLDPTAPTYRNALGIALLQLGQPSEALADFQKATELDPEYADAYLNTGVALAELGRWAEAVQAYSRAISLPRLTAADTAHINLGLALLHLGRVQEAEGALRFGLKLDPALEAGWYHLGVLLQTSGRVDEAKGAFRRAREVAPNSPFGRAALERLKALGEGG
jgi:tetratricopeptide (TPR) repeat protein